MDSKKKETVEKSNGTKFRKKFSNTFWIKANCFIFAALLKANRSVHDKKFPSSSVG